MSIYVVSQKVWVKDCEANLEIIYIQHLLTFCCLNVSKNISRKVNFKIDFNVNPFHAIGVFLKLLKIQKTRGPTIFSGVHQTTSGTK